MLVSREYIENFLLREFAGKDYRILEGDEFNVQSPFTNDSRRKLYINLNSGRWIDYTGHISGNFFSLVSRLRKISPSQAKKNVLLDAFRRGQLGLTDRIEAVKENVLLPVDLKILEGEKVELITDAIAGQSKICDRAIQFLRERKIPEGFLYLCRSGEYADRVIIPYEKGDKLYFFQARTLLKDERVKYLSPPSTLGVKSSTTLYPYDKSKDHLVVCEGPLDALSLQLHGVNATSVQTSEISLDQARELREFGGQVYIGFDRDDAGFKGAHKALNRVPEAQFLFPPMHSNDWNEAHALGDDLYEFYLKNTCKTYREFMLSTQLSALEEL